MKKLILIALAVAGAVVAIRKFTSSNQEANLWAEATDNLN